MTDENPFVINERDLGGELLKQASLARQAGRDVAEARHAFNQAKARLAVIEAKLKLRVKTVPEKFGLPDNPTIEDIKAAMIAHPDHQNATRELHEAQYVLDIAKADNTAMIDRRKGLQEKVELLKIEYYSEKDGYIPDKGLREEVESRRRQDVLGGGIKDDDD